MEKRRNVKLIIILALVIAVAGLSFGFAAFTKDLNINFSESNASISGELDVRIHSYDAQNDVIDVNSKIINYLGMSESGIEVEPFIISDDYSSISGGSLTFSNFDKFVLYTFALKNYSEYDAHLKNVSLLNGGSFLDFKTCTALTGTTQSMVDDACDNIHVAILTLDYKLNLSSLGDMELDLVIPSGESTVIGMYFIYDGPANIGDLADSPLKKFDQNPTTMLPDGDFKINFAGLKFNFSSVD